MKKISLGSRKSQLLTCTAFTAFVAAGLTSPMSLQEAMAQCGTIIAGNNTISCGSGPYNNGIVYGSGATNVASSILFDFENTQANGLNSTSNRSAVQLFTTQTNNFFNIDIDQKGLGTAPSFTGDSVITIGSVASNGFQASTNAAGAFITFDVNQEVVAGVRGTGANFTGGSATAIIIPWDPTAPVNADSFGISLATAGANNAPVTINLHNINAQGGTATAAGLGTGTASGMGVYTLGTNSAIGLTATNATFNGGTANGLAGISAGLSLSTAGATSGINVDLTNATIKGGSVLAVQGAAHGLNLNTAGATSAVKFELDGGSISGGSVNALTGTAHGVNITTAGTSSGVEFDLTNGSITGGTGLSLGHGVNIATNNTGSDIKFDSAVGTTITSSNGNGVNLVTNGSSILADGTINGTVESTLEIGGVGVGTGFNATAGGGGSALEHVGETGIVRGTGAGLIGTATGAGVVTLEVDGEVRQTSATASSANPSFFLLPVAVGGAASGSGNVTVSSSATSEISQIGSTPAAGPLPQIKGIGMLAMQTGSGNATATANGLLSATGIGVASIANSGSATTNIGGTISVGGGAGVSPVGALSLGLLDYTVGAAAVSGSNFATVNIHGGNIGDFDTLNATPDIGGIAIVAGGSLDATVDVGDGIKQASTIEANVVGLQALNLGSGDARIDIEQVDPEGDGNVVNSNGIGLWASAVSGDADVEARNSTVNSNGIGILASSITGRTWVDANDVTSQNNSAIQGFGAQVDIDVHGDAKGAGGFLTAAVAGISTGSFNVEVDEDASIDDNNSSDSTGYAINAASGTGISVVNYGTINGNMNLVSVSGDNHIENYSNNSWNWTGVTNLVTGGNNILDNYGTSSAGPLSLTNLISGGDSTVNNYSGATFNMFGLNGMTFVTGGDATINNAGDFNALGLNTFAFVSGGASTFNNTGDFNVGGLSLFLGLDTFNADDTYGNAGTINMQNGLPFGAVVMVGTDYHVESEANLYIDADVGSSPLWGADYMSVGGVSGAGVTYVHINDLNWSPGQYDPYGISLIGVEDGNADIEDFQLANGPIQKGFYDYNIYLDKGNSLDHLKCTLTNAGDCFILASTLGQRAYELPVIAYGAQQMWHTSTGVWTDRTADLRSAFGGTGFGGGGADAIVEPVEAMPVAGNVTPGIWGRVFGATQSRDFSNSYALSDLEILDDEINNNFKQDIYGAMAGIDFGKESLSDQGNQAWIFGLFGGYTGSNLSFDNTDTDVDYTAGSVGAYVTYLNGGLFIDTTIKADFGKMDYSSGGESASSDFTSVGGVVDAGYRFTRGSGWYIEPKATLAYVHTEFDDIEAFGDDVSFDNGESLRGRLGARVGTSMDRNGIVIEPYLEASLWNEFDGGYSAALFSNGTDLAPSFDAEGVYGEVALGSSFINAANGWSGFAKGSVAFGEDSALGLTGNLGVRKAW